MKRLLRAPNLMLATLWADMLRGVGIEASVQRAWAGSISGEMPPDQCLPEVWVHDDVEAGRADALLQRWRNPPWHRWLCHGCGEDVDGPFEQCWNCGAERPASGAAVAFAPDRGGDGPGAPGTPGTSGRHDAPGGTGR